MTLDRPDIVAAVATAPGIAGVSIVRVSGSGSLDLALRVFRPQRMSTIPPRRMVYGRFVDEVGEPVDDGFLVHFPAPASFTGEDVVELHTHGGRAAPATVLGLLRERGARMAEPGEFTRRAMASGRLDLAQAEAVLDVVHARSEASLRAAGRRLAGALSGRLNDLRSRMIEAKALVEVRIDFEDSDVGDVDPGEVASLLGGLGDDLASLAATYPVGRVYREGAVAVITGRPNVGKSSLLNALLGRRRAIVSEQPGTTRDAVEDDAVLGGVPFRLVDTAGLRREADRLEAEGIEMARERMADADIILFVYDASLGMTDEDRALRDDLPRVPVLEVINKIDLAPTPAATTANRPPQSTNPFPTCAVSGRGVDELARAMAEAIRGDSGGGDEVLLANERHHQQTLKAMEHVRAALEAVRRSDSPAITALELQDAAHALGEIVGDTTPDDVLGRIFGRFCIGK